MLLKTDYHIHTWYSDGTMSPKEVVEKYIDEQYDVIAITDHEVTDGIAEAKAAAEGTLIKVIPGIELATDMDGKELHILGYNIDENNLKLKETLIGLAKIRKARNDSLLKALQDKGYELSLIHL